MEYESRGDKDKNLSPEDYLDIIRPYLRNKINNHKVPIKLKDPNDTEDDLSGDWKIQLTIQITFISSLDAGKIITMDSKSDNEEIMIVYETDDIIKKLFESLKKRYQEKLEIK